jgi:hypothetical protein
VELPQVPAGSVQVLLFRFRVATAALEQGAVVAFQLHQFIDLFAKSPFVCGGVQALREFDDAWLKAGFDGLEVLDAGPGSGFDGCALVFAQTAPVLVKRRQFVNGVHGL